MRKIINFCVVAIVICCIMAGCTSKTGQITVEKQQEKISVDNAAAELPMEKTSPVATEEPTIAPTTSTSLTNTPTVSQTPMHTPVPTTVLTKEPQMTMVTQPYNEPYFADIDKDGEQEKITFIWIEERYTMLMQVADGDEVEIAEVGGFETSLYYYTNADGDVGIMLSYDSGSDDYLTKVYTFDGTIPVEISAGQGCVVAADAEFVDFFDFVFVLGTWKAYSKFSFNEDFTLIPPDDMH